LGPEDGNVVQVVLSSLELNYGQAESTAGSS
jgi:hypothetical protein